MDATQEQLEKFWDNEKQRIRSLLPTTVDAHVQTTHRVTKKAFGPPTDPLMFGFVRRQTQWYPCWLPPLNASHPDYVYTHYCVVVPIPNSFYIALTKATWRPFEDAPDMPRKGGSKVQRAYRRQFLKAYSVCKALYDRAKADWQTRMKTELPTHHHKILRAGDTISFGPIGNQTHATITKIAPVTFSEGGDWRAQQQRMLSSITVTAIAGVIPSPYRRITKYVKRGRVIRDIENWKLVPSVSRKPVHTVEDLVALEARKTSKALKRDIARVIGEEDANDFVVAMNKRHKSR